LIFPDRPRMNSGCGAGNPDGEQLCGLDEAGWWGCGRACWGATGTVAAREVTHESRRGSGASASARAAAQASERRGGGRWRCGCPQGGGADAADGVRGGRLTLNLSLERRPGRRGRGTARRAGGGARDGTRRSRFRGMPDHGGVHRASASCGSRARWEPKLVGVTFSELRRDACTTAPLFAQERRSGAVRTMDAINQKFGRTRCTRGGAPGERTTREGGSRFTYVPDLEVADGVE